MAEKVVFKNSKGLKLVGMLEPVKTDKMVILAHGFTSSKDRPKFVSTAGALRNAGIASLRFDFSGCGESDFAGITVADEVDDLKSAIEFARSKGYKDIGLLGSSLGGLCCLLAYDTGIRTIVLLAPVTKAKTPSEFQDIAKRRLLEQQGYIIIKKEDREFRIEKQYLQERESLDREKMMSEVKCPVLILHGDKDDTIPLEHSQSAIQYLPKGSKLEIIKGGSHRLEEDIGKLSAMVASWFKSHL